MGSSTTSVSDPITDESKKWAGLGEFQDLSIPAEELVRLQIPIHQETSPTA
jgi:hypothetical protein